MGNINIYIYLIFLIFQYLAFEVAYVANNLRYADFTRKKKKIKYKESYRKEKESGE